MRTTTTERVDKMETHTVVTCDFCGDQFASRCIVCRRDCCRDCAEFGPDCNGDYPPDRYCKSCWQIGESYRARVEELEKEGERLLEEWHQVAQEAAKGQQ